MLPVPLEDDVWQVVLVSDCRLGFDVGERTSKKVSNQLLVSLILSLKQVDDAADIKHDRCALAKNAY